MAALKDSIGTPCNMAPEVFNRSYGPMCDMWSLGCVVYELLVGEPTVTYRYIPLHTVYELLVGDPPFDNVAHLYRCTPLPLHTFTVAHRPMLAHTVTICYIPAHSGTYTCYIPLHAVAYRCIPLHTVAYRCVPLRTVAYRYHPLPPVTARYVPPGEPPFDPYKLPLDDPEMHLKRNVRAAVSATKPRTASRPRKKHLDLSRLLSLLPKPCTVLVRTTARDAEPCMHSTPPSAPDHQTPPRT